MASKTIIMKQTMKFFLSLVVVLACGMTISCSSDSDDDGSGSSGGKQVDVAPLIGYTFFKNEDKTTEVKNYEVTLLSPYFACVHMWGRDLDYGEGWDKWDLGEIDCLYTVSGNQIIIKYERELSTSDIIMTIKDGKPDGWSNEGRTGRPTSLETFDAQPGSTEIFGYYSGDVFRNICETMASELKAMGDKNSDTWEKTLENRWSGCYQIVDGNTIYMREEYTTLRQPSNVYIYKQDTYEVSSLGKTATFTLYYYIDTSYIRESCKYVMNGNDLVLSNGGVLKYKDGKLNWIQPNGDNYYFTKF